VHPNLRSEREWAVTEIGIRWQGKGRGRLSDEVDEWARGEDDESLKFGGQKPGLLYPWEGEILRPIRLELFQVGVDLQFHSDPPQPA
jgi:hypothetical protein